MGYLFERIPIRQRPPPLKEVRHYNGPHRTSVALCPLGSGFTGTTVYAPSGEQLFRFVALGVADALFHARRRVFERAPTLLHSLPGP